MTSISAPQSPPSSESFRFRPWPAAQMAAVSTAGFTLLTFALTAEDPAWSAPQWWLRAALACLAVSVTIQLILALFFKIALHLIGNRFSTLSGWQFQLFRWGTPSLALAVALPLGSWMVSLATPQDRAPGWRTTPLGALVIGSLVVALFYGYFFIRGRQWRAERQAAQAQLRLLQAQMEPHFLFNTLANVVGLMDSDTPRAKAMLESFTDYLRASLISLRTPEHALGAELDLIDAYLRVAKVRMDDRLDYRIDVADELRAMQVPALSLQPLVENAVLHGLEPSIDGGHLTVTARRDNGRLVIRVADDGVGLDAQQQASRAVANGTALPNIRERLRQSHGDRASLRVEAKPPRGVLATLTLPAQAKRP